MRLIFDLETDGLLDEVTRIHCLVIKDQDTGQVQTFHGHTIPAGLTDLALADEIIGHNVIRYDIPVIQKLYPRWTSKALVRDTIVCTRLIWPEIKPGDLKRTRQGFPGKLVGKHSLEAWGHRLGNYKGDFKGPWHTFTQEMLDYCVQDVEVTSTLYARIEGKKYSPEAIELEHRVAHIVALQERNGFAFDEAKAGSLYAQLVAKREELTAQLKAFFADWTIEQRRTLIPKRPNKKKGYEIGVPVEIAKTVTIQFNPASRDHIADRLKTLYGWKPSEFTDSGKPQVDETTLKDLKYPCAPMLMEYLLVDKRIGQLAEGKQAWLKLVRKGRIHGSVVTNGAVTGRMTHNHPNISQVPKVGSAYGAECRELFGPRQGWVLVGCDASGLELRNLAHFLAKWDGGAYSRAVVEGKEEEGTDVHSLNTVALGLEPQVVYTINGKQQKGRNCGKTFIYAYLYGAGDDKVSKITGKNGKLVKASFQKAFPALGKLKAAIAEAARQRGYLLGLDGRQLPIRSAHAALNTLLQSAGAVVMKKGLVLLYDALTAAGHLHMRDYAFCANVHDEWQIECRPEIAEEVGRLAVQSIRMAGEHFKFRCQLDGAYKIGNNWKETH